MVHDKSQTEISQFIFAKTRAVLYIVGFFVCVCFIYIVTAFSISWGMTTALFTLIPQALNCSNRENILALYFQRAMLIVTITCFIMCFPQFYAGKILHAIGQPYDLIGMVTDYCQTLLPSLFFVGWFTVLQRIAQALHFNWQILIILCFCAILTFPIAYSFVHFLKLGFLGAAHAVNVITFLYVQSIYMFVLPFHVFFFVLLVILIACHHKFSNTTNKKKFFFFQRQCFLLGLFLAYKGYGYLFKPLGCGVIIAKQGISEYLGLSIPGLLQSSLSFWVSQILTILAAYIVSDTSHSVIGSIVIMTNVNSICNMVWTGIAVATGVMFVAFVCLYFFILCFFCFCMLNCEFA